ncbi:MAG: sensor histidine kinase, partial [Bacteroidia bacterium]
GIILYEIITNSIKYAFPKNEGVISISLTIEKNKNILNVSDNGIGFPKSFNFEKQSSLGLQLIKLLTEQVNGNLNTNFEGQTRYTLTFS